MIGYAVIAQLGERQTEDLEVAGSIPAHGTLFQIVFQSFVPTFKHVLFIGNYFTHSRDYNYSPEGAQ